MQAEKDLINRVLQSGRIERVLSSGIEPEHFHSYRPEWEYIVNHWQRHSEAPTPDLFKDRFPKFKYRKVIADEPSVNPAVEAVKDNHLELQLAKLIKSTTGDLGHRAPGELVDKLKNGLDRLGNEREGEEEVDIVSTIMEDVKEVRRLQHSQEKEDTSAHLATPWYPLQNYWGGLGPGQVTGVIARPNEGKSWVLSAFAAYAAYKGRRPFFAPLEMSRYEMAFRLHALWSFYAAQDRDKKFVKVPKVANKARIEEMLSGRQVWRNRELSIGSKEIDYKEYREWAAAMQETMPRGFIIPKIEGSGRFDFNRFARHVERSECDIAFLDYFTLLQENTGNRQSWEVWQEVANNLKMLARRLNIPIVVAAQANRGATLSKTPELEDIAQSDAFGQATDRVLSIKTKGNDMTITCIKNRHGENRFRFHLDFFPDFGIMEYNKQIPVEEGVGK